MSGTEKRVAILLHPSNFSGAIQSCVNSVREEKSQAVLISERNGMGVIGFKSVKTGRMAITRITLSQKDYLVMAQPAP